MPASRENAGEPGAALMQAELARLLASAQLCKAPQASRLLSFLVAAAAGGRPGAANEYAIGLAVFGRDAATYSTGEDPIVRVQMGRLRAKLGAFYAGPGGQGARWRMEIPLGSYTPLLVPGTPAPRRLAFLGLACIALAPAVDLFTRALAEELRFRLHRQFGARLAVAGADQHGAAQMRELGIGYVLDGSVREDAGQVRTVFRLLDVARGQVAWSEQFDHAGALTIACQEGLAARCCDALAAWLAA